MSSAIQIVKTQSEATSIKDSATRRGLKVFTVDVDRVNSKASLLEAIGKSLALPDHYGQNWDALEESLRDFPDSANKGWLLCFEQADRLLALSHQDVVALASILSEASQFWTAEGKTLAALFIGSSNLSSALAA